MTEGLLIKGYNGFYYVAAEGVIWTCFLRGKFRIKKQNFLPGDRVLFTKLEYPKGVIEQVLGRTNELIRPAVSNVDTALITFAFSNPSVDFLLLDRILIHVMDAGINPVICFNKCDTVSEDVCINIMNPYIEAGFCVLKTSAYENIGIDKLKSVLTGRISVLAGPSGVGKSSIINAIDNNFQLKTGGLSKKTDRGKHTTRRVELLPFKENSFIVDTPGFSALDLPQKINKNRLADYYPEFGPYSLKCRFNSCLHEKELDCAVIDAMNNGFIDKGRFERYLTFLNEIKDKENIYK